MASSRPAAISSQAKGIANSLLVDFYRAIAHDKPACYFISNVTSDPSDQSDNGKSFDFMVVLDSMPGYAFDMSFMFKLASRRTELRKGMAYLYEQFVKQVVLVKKDAFLREYPAEDVYELSIDVDLDFHVSRRLYACNRVCRQLAQVQAGGSAPTPAVHDGLEHVHDVLLSISPDWYFGDYVESCRARGAKPILPPAVYLEFFRLLDPPPGQDYLAWPVEVLRFLHACCPAQLVNGRGVSPADGKNIAVVSLLDLITSTAAGGGGGGVKQGATGTVIATWPAVPWGKLVMVSEEQCEELGAALPPHPPPSRAGAPYVSRQVYVPALVAPPNTAQYGVGLHGAGGAQRGPSATAGMPRGGPSARLLQKGPPGGLVRTSLHLPPQPRRAPSSSSSAWPPPRYASAAEAGAGAVEEGGSATSGLQDLFAAYRTMSEDEGGEKGGGGSGKGGAKRPPPARSSAAGKRKRRDSSSSGESDHGRPALPLVGKEAREESAIAGPSLPIERDKAEADKALAALVADSGKIGKGKMVEILAENIAYKRQIAELGGQLRRARASAAAAAAKTSSSSSGSRLAEGGVDAATREKITKEAVGLAFAAHGQCVPLSTAEALRRKAAELEHSLEQARERVRDTDALLALRPAAAAGGSAGASSARAAAAASAASTAAAAAAAPGSEPGLAPAQAQAPARGGGASTKGADAAAVGEKSKSPARRG